jgi:DNA polymerase III subunit delta'
MPFRDIVGHRRALSLLARSIARGSLPPSLIFSGPDGVGKRLAALATAQALNCLSPANQAGDGLEVDGCGTCAACRRISRGVHPDVRTVVPGDSGAIKIEQVRDVIDQATYRPFEGRRRVVVIDEADALTEDAQSALLKTLEEPAPASVFVLVTSRPHVLLATVRSRCSQVRFGGIDVTDLAGMLVRAHGYEELEARAVASLADGSIGRALAARASDLKEARAAAGRLLREIAPRPDARVRVNSGMELLASAKRDTPALQRERVAIRLQALASLLRDLGILATGADTRLLANLDLRPGLDDLAGTFDSERALRAFTAVDRAEAALERNVSPKVVADWLALQL